MTHMKKLALVGAATTTTSFETALKAHCTKAGIEGEIVDLRAASTDAQRDGILVTRAQGGVVVFFQTEADAQNLQSTAHELDLYDQRVLLFKDEDEAVAAERLVARLTASPWFTSTRGAGGDGYDFLHVVKSGISPDGGLYMPQALPSFALRELQFLQNLPYAEAATYVLESFLPHLNGTRSVSPQELKKLVQKAYSTERWEAQEGQVCPVKTVGAGNDAAHIVELYHGPTAAFKDFALQLFPKFFTKSIARSASQYVILAATSGDTGVAAINGFMQESGIAILVLYPKNGVSAVQKKQMLACDGGNVRVVGVDADFDFCQTTVKKIFNNVQYKETLKQSNNAVLSSANSINWGRLLPQIVYYIHAYARLIKQGVIKVGDEVDVCVPTGNFGNILSAYVAKKCGLPFRRFVCASNVNNVLTDFIQTGKYTTHNRSLTLTASPSIDILKSSNVERFLYILSGRDDAFVAKCMSDLDSKGEFEVTPAVKAAMDADFASGCCTEAECLETIKDVQDKHDYLLDTHTACGYKVLVDYKKSLREKGVKEVPVLLAATASFAKFPDAVKEVCRMFYLPPTNQSTQGLDGAAAPSLKPYDVKEVYANLAGRVSTKVPAALAKVVAADTDMTDLHVCEKSEDKVMSMLSVCIPIFRQPNQTDFIKAGCAHSSQRIPLKLAKIFSRLLILQKFLIPQRAPHDIR